MPTEPLPVASADLQQQHVGLRSIFFVVLIAGVHQELVAGETLRPVTLFAGLARRAQVLYRRWNRARIGVESNGNHLPQAGKLRPHEPSRARSDVTLDAGHARVRRILIGGVFGIHHGMARLAAEIGRVHVLDTAVRGGPDDQKIEHGRHGYIFQGATHHGQAKVDGGKTAGRAPAVRADCVAGSRCRGESAAGRGRKCPAGSDR